MNQLFSMKIRKEKDVIRKYLIHYLYVAVTHDYFEKLIQSFLIFKDQRIKEVIQTTKNYKDNVNSSTAVFRMYRTYVRTFQIGM